MSGTGANKQPILEIDLNVALCGLDITFEQFVDLCILCGCDYCSSIKGIGPKTALKLIRQYKTLEGVVQFVKRDTKKKYQLPKDWTSYRLKPESLDQISPPNDESPERTTEDATELLTEPTTIDGGSENPINGTPKVDGENLLDSDDDFCVPDLNEEEVEDDDEDIDFVDLQNNENDQSDSDSPNPTETPTAEETEEGELIQPMFIRARELFYNHEVINAADIELKWLPPQEEELRRFLVERMGFNPERVENGIRKLVEAQGKKAQQRLDRFDIFCKYSNMH